MGQAKQRQAQLCRPLDPSVIANVARAVRRLATAASSRLGGDCFVHAAIGAELLHRLGYTAELVVGEAAWRVGAGDADVIAHCTRPETLTAVQPQAKPFHAWLHVQQHVLDLTTYQLTRKAAMLDALDGGHTTVIWCPDYLLLPFAGNNSFEAVRALGVGLSHYRRDRQIESEVCRSFRADPHDAEMAWLIYQHPDTVVRGPNDFDEFENEPPHG